MQNTDFALKMGSVSVTQPGSALVNKQTFIISAMLILINTQIYKETVHMSKQNLLSGELVIQTETSDCWNIDMFLKFPAIHCAVL